MPAGQKESNISREVDVASHSSAFATTLRDSQGLTYSAVLLKRFELISSGSSSTSSFALDTPAALN